jgi:hypothetical protein
VARTGAATATKLKRIERAECGFIVAVRFGLEILAVVRTETLVLVEVLLEQIEAVRTHDSNATDAEDRDVGVVGEAVVLLWADAEDGDGGDGPTFTPMFEIQSLEIRILMPTAASPIWRQWSSD